MTSKKKGPKKPVPAALVKHTAALAARKRKEILAQSLDDIAVVKEKQREATSAFYEIGLALQRLSRPAAVEALGHRTFDELLEARLAISPAQAERLITIVEHVTEADAIRWLEDRSLAVAQLKRLPGVKELSGNRLRLPSKRVVDPDETPTTELVAAAERERHALQKPGKRTRGRTTTPDERGLGRDLGRALAARGVAAKIQCIATRPGKPSDLQVRFSTAHAGVLLRLLRG